MFEERDEILVEETPAEAAEEAVQEAAPAEEAPAEAAAPAEEAAPAKEETMADYADRLDPESFNKAKWEHFKEMMNAKEVFTVTVKNAVKGGVVAYVDDMRAFIPSSHISLSHIDDLETVVEKELEVRIIEADQAKNRLVLSAREVLRDRQRAERKKAIEDIAVGSVFHGTVESLQSYGAFVRLENGMSGLVHVSQIANKRIKAPSEVLKEGQEVDVKVIAIKDGKLSLSMRALLENAKNDEDYQPRERVVIPKAEKLSTSLGDLLKGIQL